MTALVESAEKAMLQNQLRVSCAVVDVSLTMQPVLLQVCAEVRRCWRSPTEWQRVQAGDGSLCSYSGLILTFLCPTRTRQSRACCHLQIHLRTCTSTIEINSSVNTACSRDITQLLLPHLSLFGNVRMPWQCIFPSLVSPLYLRQA